MALKDRLADELHQRDVEPRSPGSWQPAFDVAFEHDGTRFVVEIKSGDPVNAQQVRLGVGQVLEYCHLLGDAGPPVRPVLLLEGAPPPPWPDLLERLGVAALDSNNLSRSLDTLFAASSARPA